MSAANLGFSHLPMYGGAGTYDPDLYYGGPDPAGVWQPPPAILDPIGEAAGTARKKSKWGKLRGKMKEGAADLAALGLFADPRLQPQSNRALMGLLR